MAASPGPSTLTPALLTSELCGVLTVSIPRATEAMLLLQALGLMCTLRGPWGNVQCLPCPNKSPQGSASVVSPLPILWGTFPIEATVSLSSSSSFIKGFVTLQSPFTEQGTNVGWFLSQL